MVLLNLFFQLLVVHGMNKNTSKRKMLKEVMITLLFLRPAVDACRVCTNHKSTYNGIDALEIMIINKGSRARNRGDPRLRSADLRLVNEPRASRYERLSIDRHQCDVHRAC